MFHPGLHFVRRGKCPVLLTIFLLRRAATDPGLPRVLIVRSEMA